MSEIGDKINFAWENLMQTTITGKQYAAKGQPDTGKWGEAKRLLQEAINLSNPAPPAPIPSVVPQKGLAAGSPEFVVQYHGGDFSRYADIAFSVKPQVLRFDFQSGSGTSFKKLYDQCKILGIDVLPILMITGTKTLQQVKDEATYLANNYSVKKVELGNEVNRSNGWKTTPDYADYVTKAAAASIILRQKGIFLCASGLSQGGGLVSAQQYLQGCLNAGLDNYVDAYGVHAYGEWGRHTFLPGIRSTLGINNITKKIWVTECGSSTTGAITEQMQSDEISAIFREFEALGYVDDFHVYSVIDHNSGGTNVEDNYGLFTTGGTSKIAASTFLDAILK